MILCFEKEMHRHSVIHIHTCAAWTKYQKTEFEHNWHLCHWYIE